ncbi:hypothetical protein PSTT_07962 [Puccinia striiformis]|uniref:Uncharacterized protein n=1 Tax=Puccinia striiformis TaxID=27350 RepID=A0A2S4VEB2_9BASI|nr:hypothetical protein PSTT_07962 [Puccinia striiformis]
MRPRSQNRSWCTDGVHGGPASVNILLRWLERSGNYARWVSSDHRIRLCGEIVEEMEHHGIHHRSATSLISASRCSKNTMSAVANTRRLAASQGNYDDPNGEGIFVADRTILGGRGWARLHNIMGHM